VTGGAGFIGSHLVEALLLEGHKVCAIDDLSTGRVENLEGVIDEPRFQFVRACITDEIVLDRLASQADVVIHLAAAVGVKRIVERPVETIETNVIGTEHVLKVALRYNCRVLVASTSEVYGKGSKIPFAEDDDVLLGPTNKSRWAYAASKMVDEFLALAYARQFGLDVVVFRLFNTVGARQCGRYGMVVPRFVRQALQNRPITVYGNGLQSRCFCDVRDVIRAIIGLSQRKEAASTLYNIGGTEEISIVDLAKRIKTLTGSTSEIVLVPYDEAYAPGFEDMYRRLPDTSRIASLLGWQPRHALNDILSSVIAYEENRALWNAREEDAVEEEEESRRSRHKIAAASVA
jgi:UDP-glucose 4-epimerase